MTAPTNGFWRTKKQTAKRSFLIGAFDTETDRIGEENADMKKAVRLCTFFHENMDGPQLFHNVADFLEHILCEWDAKILRKTIWFSHNGEFDWRFLIAHFRDYDDLYEIRAKERATNKFYELELIDRSNGKRITRFRDSMALYPASLADFSSKFASDHVKGNIGLSWQNFDPKNQIHLDYALNDARALVVSLQNFDATIFKIFGVHLKGTISATAYAAMKTFLPDGEKYWRQSPSVEKWLRECYYGGRVQLHAPKTTPVANVSVYDINSSYPAQMRKGVPKGKASFTRKYHPGKPAFYHVAVNVPENLAFPPIPKRDSKFGLSFPVGSFETFCANIELERLRELGGSFEIIDGYFFDETCFPFNDFVDLCETTRAAFKKTPTENVIKLIQNSVYGKFGTRQEGREVIISYAEHLPEGFSPSIDEETGEDFPNVFFKLVPRDAEYMLPHWAAWITANARIDLDQGISAAGRENVLYCDTDSLHINEIGHFELERNPHLIGPIYGQYKFEGTFKEEAYHGPKAYSSVTAKGEIEIKMKGIPKNLLREPDKSDPAFVQKAQEVHKRRERLHAGEIDEIGYFSSTSLLTNLKTGKLSIRRTRRPTNADHVFGHVVRDGFWRPRQERAI